MGRKWSCGSLLRRRSPYPVVFGASARVLGTPGNRQGGLGGWVKRNGQHGLAGIFTNDQLVRLDGDDVRRLRRRRRHLRRRSTSRSAPEPGRRTGRRPAPSRHAFPQAMSRSSSPGTPRRSASGSGIRSPGHTAIGRRRPGECRLPVADRRADRGRGRLPDLEDPDDELLALGPVDELGRADIRISESPVEVLFRVCVVTAATRGVCFRHGPGCSRRGPER